MADDMILRLLRTTSSLFRHGLTPSWIPQGSTQSKAASRATALHQKPRASGDLALATPLEQYRRYLTRGLSLGS